jgi:hypothetical protein
VTASSIETRILIRDRSTDLLIARLGPLEHAQRFALRSLLEAVALWDQQRVDVVLFADDGSSWERTGLVDALGIAREAALLKVDLVPAELRGARNRLTGLGSFERERRLLESVGSHG